MNRASFSTGDRVWRMPLWNYYSNHMKSKQICSKKLSFQNLFIFYFIFVESATADLNNISAVAGGGSCTAAAFLKVIFQVLS